MTDQYNKCLGYGWEETWQDMAKGGPLRWKLPESIGCHATSLTYLETKGYLPKGGSVFVPFSGDSEFCTHAYNNGYTVIANDYVAYPIECMLTKLKDSTKFDSKPLLSDPSFKVHTSADKRFVAWQCKLSNMRDELKDKPLQVDVVYDKDAFGAGPIDGRPCYVKTVLSCLKPGGLVMLEVKDKAKDGDETSGPPFHITRAQVEHYWCGETGPCEILDYSSSFYALPKNTADWKQQMFLLRKKDTIPVKL